MSLFLSVFVHIHKQGFKQPKSVKFNFFPWFKSFVHHPIVQFYNMFLNIFIMFVVILYNFVI